MERKITREEKLATLDYLMKKYPEKKFLEGIKKTYE